jgi:hypothetical protein
MLGKSHAESARWLAKVKWRACPPAAWQTRSNLDCIVEFAPFQLVEFDLGNTLFKNRYISR